MDEGKPIEGQVGDIPVLSEPPKRRNVVSSARKDCGRVAAGDLLTDCQRAGSGDHTPGGAHFWAAAAVPPYPR